MKSIYTIAPSWPVQKEKDFLDGVKTLEKLGFRVVPKTPVTKLLSLRSKVNQIHKAFANQNAEIILAQRGGYSSMKLLPHLDFGLLMKNPKTFAGFSDLSALLNGISERTGLVTLHAPMVIHFAKPSKFTVRSFLNALNGFPEKNLFAGAPVEICRPGIARGILKGGNLVTLSALFGTEWEIDTAGSILFLEELGEKLYRVDRLLTQWILAGKFQKLEGLILGNFRGLKNEEVSKILPSQMKVGFPVAHCPYIGHGRNKVTLPVGAAAELNASRKTLTVL